MIDERVERVRAYLVANGVWGNEASDLWYLIDQLDALKADVQLVKEAGMWPSNDKLKWFREMDALTPTDGDVR